MDTLQTFQKIETAAKGNQPKLRLITEMSVGEAIRQGDLYLERIAKLPKDVTATTNRQLAIGETQGSRHVATGPVEIFNLKKNDNPLAGPVISAKDAWTLTHPEHGHFTLPAGCYRTAYQRDYARERADEIRRVTD